MRNPCIGIHRHILAAGAMAATGISFAAGSAQAAVSTWTGNDASTNSGWTDGNNWSPTAAPSNDGTASVVYAASPSTATASAVDTNYSINSVLFQGGAPAYSIGSAASAVLTVGSGGITDASTATETINAPVDLGSPQTWSASNLDGNLLVNGIVGGGGPLTISGPGTVTLTNSNTYTGGTTLTSGTLAITSSSGADQALGDPSGTLTFAGGTLETFGPPAGVSSRNVAVNSAGGTLNIQSDFFMAGSFSGTGTLTKTGSGTLSLEADFSAYTGNVDLRGGTVALYVYNSEPLGPGNVTLEAGTTLSLADQIQGSPSSPDTTTANLAAGSTGAAAFTYGAGGGELAPQTASTDGGSIFITTLGSNTDGSTPNLVRSPGGTLIIAPSNGTSTSSFGVIEIVNVPGSAGNLPAVINGIVSPSIVGQNNDGNATGDFLTYNASKGFISAASEYTTGITGSSTEIANVSNATGITGNYQVYALRDNAAVITISPVSMLTVGDNTSGHQAGIIFNGTGGAINEGPLYFGASEGVVYTAQSATIGAAIQGTGGLTTFGPGTLTLTGVDSYTGNTNINGQYNGGDEGSVILTAAGSLGDTPVTVNQYATFTDDGAVDSSITVDGILRGAGGPAGALTVNSGGLVEPGDQVPANMNSGNLTLNHGSTAQFDLDGADIGSLSVTGTVTLNDATLEVDPLAGTVPLGSLFFIIDNDGTDPVSGTFLNLPQGSVYTSSDGQHFVVSYDGNSSSNSMSGGNDVVLEAVATVPEPASLGVLAAGLVAGTIGRRRRRSAATSPRSDA